MTSISRTRNHGMPISSACLLVPEKLVRASQIMKAKVPKSDLEIVLKTEITDPDNRLNSY